MINEKKQSSSEYEDKERGKVPNSSEKSSSYLPIYDDDIHKKSEFYGNKICVTSFLIHHYCLTTICLVITIVAIIYLIIPSGKKNQFGSNSPTRNTFGNNDYDDSSTASSAFAINRKGKEDNMYSEQMEYFELSSDLGNTDMFVIPSENSIEYNQFRSFKKMTYQFKEKINVTDLKKTIVFYHPTNGKILGFNQNQLVSYRLCCSIFHKLEKTDTDFSHSKKVCGNSDSIKCIIEDERLMVYIDLSFLDSPNYFEVISICIFNWFSKQ